MSRFSLLILLRCVSPTCTAQSTTLTWWSPPPPPPAGSPSTPRASAATPLSLTSGRWSGLLLLKVALCNFSSPDRTSPEGRDAALLQVPGGVWRVLPQPRRLCRPQRGGLDCGVWEGAVPAKSVCQQSGCLTFYMNAIVFITVTVRYKLSWHSLSFSCLTITEVEIYLSFWIISGIVRI